MHHNIVITMAGRGSRFYQAGYTAPKYAITAHGHTLFEWAMISLNNFFKTDSRIIFVCLEENKSIDFVQSKSQSMGLNDIHFLELPKITDGQATSAYLAKDLYRTDEPLLIYNIDTFVQPQSINPELIRPGSDGWIPCFQTPGEHWSFVKPGDNGWAVDVAEKKRISDYASVGLYWFSSAFLYTKIYDKFFANPVNLVNGERYIAPLYKQLLADDLKVSMSDLPAQHVHAIGTPDELIAFQEKNILFPWCFGREPEKSFGVTI